MRRCISLLVLAIIVTPALSQLPSKDDAITRAVHALYGDIRHETLPNGLRIFMKPIAGAPTVAIMTTYRVGSADEDLQHTGLAHYLEHLMFKGTGKLMPGDIDHLTRRAGGHNNAYTTEDYTNFHFEFAAERWEVALTIEADRMRNLRIDDKHEFQQEKGAVISELDGNEDEPWDLERKAILPLLFGGKSPYGHPIIGERDHVRAATAEIIKGFYDRWYHPNNASIVIVGGFDPTRAMARIKEMFGPIPAGKLPERRQAEPITRDKPVHKEIESKFGVDRFVMGFNTGKMGDEDDYVLDVIQYILSGGKTSRLYRRLVLDLEVAGMATCSNLVGMRPGWFEFDVEVMKGTKRKDAEKALLDEIDKLRRESVSEAELKKVVRNTIAGMIFEREDIHELADAIAMTATMAHPDYLSQYIARIQKVTAADIQRVAQKYFDPNKRVVVWSLAGNRPGAPAKPPRKPEPGRTRSRQPREPLIHAGAGVADLTQTRRVVLDNGLKLLLLENHRLPIVLAQARVGDTDLHEPADKAGVAALLGLLLEEGSEVRSEDKISEAIENVGGVLAMSADGGSVKVLSPDRSLGLGLLIECLTRPALNRDSVRRLKEHLLSEIEDVQAQPNLLAQEMFLKAVYGDHPLGRPAKGTEETAQKLTPADCRKFHGAVFVANNKTLVIVGDFNAEAVINEVTELTKAWKKKPLPALQLASPKLPAQFVQTIKTVTTTRQLHVYLGQVGIRRTDPDYFALLAMDHILGVGSGFTDRLSSRLRDRQGLAYTVTASITATAGKEPGAFSAYIGTYGDKFDIVKKTMLEEIERMRREKPSDQEMADVKSYLLDSLPFKLATLSETASLMSTIERYDLGWDYLAKYRKSLEAVTAEQVRDAAHKHLKPERMALIAVGPIDAKGKQVPVDE